MREVSFVLNYVRRYWPRYLLGILALAAVDLVNSYVPQYTGEVTDLLSAGNATMAKVMPYIWMILGMGAIIAIGRFAWRYFLFGAARTIEKDMRDDLFAHLETLDMVYFNHNKTGDLMTRFINDLNAVRQLVGMTVIATFDASVMLILVLGRMILYVSPKLTCVAIIPLMVIIIGNFFYGREMHKRFLEKQDAFSKLSDHVQESVSGIRVIKAFVQEQLEMRRFLKSNLFCQEKNLRVARLQAIVMPLMDVIIGSSSLITLLYGGYMAITGEITLGQFVAFNSYIGMLVWPMLAVSECITQISQGLASVKRLMAIHNEKSEIRDDESKVNKSITGVSGQISIKHLTFSYPGHESEKALDDISVEIPAGSSLAIVGRTGCGKTTMASLLMRMYNTEDGMITFDGHNIREIPVHALRSSIGYVPQDNFLFSDTIANNIAFGLKDIPMEEIEQAAKDACIHDNIMEFPEGYNTVVGERGATISGGQKQRSSIARALLKNAPILILDDSLSAVDTDTEEQILQSLKKRCAGKTVIMIAHRISTIEHCDRILVLDEGKMIEYGTHQELLDKGGVYRGIYDKQQLEKQLQQDNLQEGGVIA